MKHWAEKAEQDVAIRLGCIEIKRIFKHMQQNALEKKSNMEFLEKEIGLKRFLPKKILDSVKVSTCHLC
jgi:focal adhesion kinase 1